MTSWLNFRNFLLRGLDNF